MTDVYRVEGILKKEDYHFILQRHAIPCGRRLIGDRFVLYQPKAQIQTTVCNSFGEKQSADILPIM